MLFDWPVVGQVVPMNPAASVRGPKHVVRRGKTAVLATDQARKLLGSIETSSLAALRDRAAIGVMVCGFTRVGAVIAMKAEDHCPGGKTVVVPAQRERRETSRGPGPPQCQGLNGRLSAAAPADVPLDSSVDLRGTPATEAMSGQAAGPQFA